MNWWLWILVGIGIWALLILSITVWFHGAYQREGELMSSQERTTEGSDFPSPPSTIWFLGEQCYLCDRVFEEFERVCYLLTRPAENVTRYRMVHVDCENR